MSQSPNDSPEASTSSVFARLWRRRRQLFVAFLLLIFGVPALLILDNNFSFSGTSRSEIRDEMDHAFKLGVNWIRKGDLVLPNANPALLLLIRDMADPVAYPRLEHIMDVHLKTKSNNIWYLMVDPSADVSFETIEEQMTNLVQYQRWLVYSLAPDETKLSKDDYRGLYSPDANRFRQLTHQLLALWILREKGHSEDGISEEDIDDLINTLCERIAGEMVWDFRVTDLYLQRVACLLAAGRPDLIKRRWIERILTNQTSDGGFRGSWYRWGPGAFRFNSTSPPTDHATVQAVWLLYMLMHRYPDWVEENFSD